MIKVLWKWFLISLKCFSLYLFLKILLATHWIFFIGVSLALIDYFYRDLEKIWNMLLKVYNKFHERRPNKEGFWIGWINSRE
jgi:ABC-type polysaccharide/polyol phosphate export permease